MQLIELTTKKQKRSFLKFRQGLYANDPHYVCTDNFVLKDMLFGLTKFAAGCTVRPVAVINNGCTVAQAMLIHSPRLSKVQIGFFDALEQQFSAVELIKKAAMAMTAEVGADGVIVGLNGHISLGVGILTEGFHWKNSFDSLYNKSDYQAYFSDCPAHGLSTYKCALDDVIRQVSFREGNGIKVRTCSLKYFEDEMRLMRELCEKTIAQTYLYFPTDEGHFYELTRDLRPFLAEEDLLFAENSKGETVGFLFSHPDFNQMLKGGREYSLFGIGCAFLCRQKKIDTVKINALGSLTPRATHALLRTFAEQRIGKYEYVETNFIWDDNRKSASIAETLMGAAHRRYEVYEYHESDNLRA